MINFLCNAFNDPSSPWYYVIGVLFLLAVLGALAVYIWWGNKKKKQGGKDNQVQDADNVAAPSRDEVTESADATKDEQDKE